VKQKLRGPIQADGPPLLGKPNDDDFQSIPFETENEVEKN